MKYLVIISFLVCACRGPQGLGGSTGGTGPSGPAGATGASGTNGTNGINGTNGVNGTNGTNGTDATPVTWVQFCQGTPSYPSTFPEGGFCINGNIYAVYSTNDGFLTLVPPGTYSSDGVGSSCDFTILADCQIQD
jgi:hypothetical protein